MVLSGIWNSMNFLPLPTDCLFMLWLWLLYGEWRVLTFVNYVVCVYLDLSCTCPIFFSWDSSSSCLFVWKESFWLLHLVQSCLGIKWRIFSCASSSSGFCRWCMMMIMVIRVLKEALVGPWIKYGRTVFCKNNFCIFVSSLA